MDLNTINTAKKYNKLKEIKELENDLLAIKYCKKVDFDLSGFYDNMNQVIILPFFDVKDNDPNCFEKKEQFELDVTDICIKHKLVRTKDCIEDYESCFYMVFNGVNGAWRTPVPTNELPPSCFSVDPETGDLIEIMKGTDGYFIMCVQFKTKELNLRKAEKFNADLGVTRRQVAAMLYGALHGWDLPGADPKHYTVSGTPFVNSFT